MWRILIYTFSSYIASTILKNQEARLSIISLSLLVPLISLGGLIKGYYMGIGKIEVSAYSQISEEIARIIFIILFVNIFKDKGDAYLAYGAFLPIPKPPFLSRDFVPPPSILVMEYHPLFNEGKYGSDKPVVL